MAKSLVGTMILDAAKTAGLMGGVGESATESQSAPPTSPASGSGSVIDLKGSLAPLMDDATGLLDTVGSNVISAITDSALQLHQVLLEIHQAMTETSIVSKLMNLALDEIKVSVRTIADDVGLVMTELLGLREAVAPIEEIEPVVKEPKAEESTAPKWMTAIMEAIKDIKDAPGRAGAAAGRAVGMAKDKALGIPGVGKAAGIIKEGMNISSDVGGLLKKPAMAQVGMAKAAAGKALGAVGGGGGKMAAKAAKGMAVGIPNMAKSLKGMAGKGLGMAGISVSVSSLLRQSQIFTGFIGALFQILGGFVDVILAPFMPYLFKVLQKMASYIPMVAAFAQKLHDWLVKNVFPIISEWAGKIVNKIMAAYNWVKDTFFTDIGTKYTGIKTYFTGLWGQVKEAFAPLWETIQDVWGRVKKVVIEDLWPLLKKVYEVAMPIFERIRDFLVDTIMPLVTTIFNELIKIYTDVVLGIIEKVAPFIEEQLPMIKDRIIEVIDKLDELLKPLKEAITGIAEDLAPKIDSLLTWMEENIFPLIEKITGVFFDNIITMMDLIQDLWDIAYPSIQKIIEDFDKNVMPIIEEMSGYAVEIIDALLDIINPLVDLLIPIVRIIWKIAWFFIEKYLKMVFKVLGFLWMLVKPVIKLTIWILRKLPAIIQSVADFVAGFLEFKWIKTFFAHLLSAVLVLVKAIDKIPMVNTENAQRSLEATIATLKTQGTGGGGGILNIEITNVVDGIEEPSQSQKFDSSDRNYKSIMNSLDLGHDASSLWRADPVGGYS